MDFRVIERFIRISAFKTRKVADVIRGKKVEEALTILKYLPKKSSGILEKAIRSAVATAEQSSTPAAIEDLFIKKLMINEGPTMKRYNFRAQGRVYRVRKRTSHIEVIVSEIEKSLPKENKSQKSKVK